jgi:hypothetical protein
MKYIKSEGRLSEGRDLPILELTRRNLLALLAKLEDPTSAQTLIDPDRNIAVRAVADDAHYTDREAGEVKREHVDKFEDKEWAEDREREAADEAAGERTSDWIGG